MLLRLYQRSLSRFPLLTHSLTVGTILPLTDTISQRAIEGRKQQDYMRTARFAFLGFAFIGPVLHKWLKVLERLFGSSGKGFAPIKKVLADQIIFAPFLNTSVIVILEQMQRKSWAETRAKLDDVLFDVLKNSYKLWPAAQCINFYLVPIQYRVLFVTVVAMFWNIYLTWKLGHD